LHKHLGAEFVYQEELAALSVAAAVADAAAVASLPADLQERAKQVLPLLDVDAISALIDEIEVYEHALARRLTTLARDFRYGEMLSLFEEASALESQDLPHRLMH
jgi:hypothetical protein